MSETDEKYLARLRARYRKARKKERSAILDEYVKTTGHHRKYTIGVLRGKRKQAKQAIYRSRRSIYGDEEAQALLKLSQAQPCWPAWRAAQSRWAGGKKQRGF